MKTSKTIEIVPSAVMPAKPGKMRVGQVNAEERDEMKALFERKNALVELIKTLADAAPMNETLYEKVIADLGKVTTRSSQWWASMSRNNQWESAPDGSWEIDFDDGSIYLTSPERPKSRKHNP